MIKAKIFIISGPSGVGKDTIIKGILKKYPDLVVVKSYTSRSKRKSDEVGNRKFISHKQFKKMIDNNEMIEYTEFCGNYYGRSKKDIEKVLQQNKNIILETDAIGVKNYKNLFPDKTISISIRYENPEQLMKRIEKNRPETSTKDLSWRLDTMKKEKKYDKYHNYKIINYEGKPQKAIEKVAKIIKTMTGRKMNAKKAKVLIIGKGGREHALGWKLAQSNKVEEIFYSPGNAGTALEQKSENIEIDGTKKENFKKLFNWIKNNKIDLVIVGPEAPLVDGIVDYFHKNGYKNIFGPTKKATKLESDKFYSYDTMKFFNIPQAESVKCRIKKQAIKAIEKMVNKDGIVIKARGLTGGKGVSVCDNKKQALKQIKEHFKKYGTDVLISERLFGEEFSIFAISDGNKVYPIKISLQDHKPLLDKDKGPNTGGMGAYGPAPIANKKTIEYITNRMLTPIVKKMKEDNNIFKGLLYAGMMMTKDGAKVIEFNVRFGDPECQPAMMMIESDLYEIISAALKGKLDKLHIKFKPGAACCVVMASREYPKKYKKGFPITGFDKIDKIDNLKVFHAGTVYDNESIITDGGRILGITAYSKKGIKQARSLAYKAVKKIKIQGGFHYRKDIANKALRNDL